MLHHGKSIRARLMLSHNVAIRLLCFICRGILIAGTCGKHCTASNAVNYKIQPPATSPQKLPQVPGTGACGKSTGFLLQNLVRVYRKFLLANNTSYNII